MDFTFLREGTFLVHCRVQLPLDESNLCSAFSTSGHLRRLPVCTDNDESSAGCNQLALQCLWYPQVLQLQTFFCDGISATAFLWKANVSSSSLALHSLHRVSNDS